MKFNVSSETQSPLAPRLLLTLLPTPTPRRTLWGKTYSCSLWTYKSSQCSSSGQVPFLFAYLHYALQSLPPTPLLSTSSSTPWAIDDIPIPKVNSRVDVEWMKRRRENVASRIVNICMFGFRVMKIITLLTRHCWAYESEIEGVTVIELRRAEPQS